MGRLLALATGAAVMDGVKLLYNNDGENLWAVDSSGASAGAYHPRTGSAIDTATIRGSARDGVDEGTIVSISIEPSNITLSMFGKPSASLPHCATLLMSSTISAKQSV